MNLPAAVLEVELVEIQDQQDERIDEIWDAFQNPVVFRVIDLRETAEIEDMLQKEEEKEVHTNTGTAEDEAGDLLADKREICTFRNNRGSFVCHRTYCLNLQIYGNILNMRSFTQWKCL